MGSYFTVLNGRISKWMSMISCGSIPDPFNHYAITVKKNLSETSVENILKGYK